MKRCPTCNGSYADDTLAFCLQDGAPLRVDYDPEATVIVAPRTSNSNRIYQVIIALLVLAGAGIGLYAALTRHNPPTEAATVTQPSPEAHTYDPLALLAIRTRNLHPVRLRIMCCRQAISRRFPRFMASRTALRASC